ncbi:hypothetical protein [Mucilaginibacter antarcticus]
MEKEALKEQLKVQIIQFLNLTDLTLPTSKTMINYLAMDWVWILSTRWS